MKSTYLYSYQTLGLDVTEGRSQINGTCPQCDESKLCINKQTGQWVCNGCHTKGNMYSMLEIIHTLSMDMTTSADYVELYKEKEVLPQTLKLWGFAKNYLTGEWVMPVYNEKGVVVNLHRYATPRDGKKPIMMSHPGCYIHPFGLQFLKPNQKTVWVVEGAWDTPSMYDILTRTTYIDSEYTICTPYHKDALINTIGVLGSPGAMMWSKKWAKYLANKHTNVAFDNDHPKKFKRGVVKPGYDGAIRTASLLTESVTTNVVHWGEEGHDPDLPNKYDIRDLARDDGRQGAIHYLNECLVPYKSNSTSTPHQEDSDQFPPIECTSFSDLLKPFSKLHITDKWRTTFAAMLAVNLSTRMEGDPVWLRVIGPPGCGKTLIAECISYNRRYTKPLSSMTGIKSGYAGGKLNKDGTREDSSLIPLINNKNLMIKDGDTLMNGANLDQLLAEFRDLFDGATRSQYRNAQGCDYEDVKTSLTLCGTNQLRRLNRANLGERFIDIEIVDKHDRNKLANAASRNSLDRIHESVRRMSSNTKDAVDIANSVEMVRKRTTAGFIDYLHNNHKIIEFSDTMVQRITHIGDWTAHIRSRVHKDEIDTSPDIEFHSRVSSQLIKLGYFTANVIGKPEVDRDVLQMLKSIAWYTADGHQRSIVVQLFKTTDGLSVTNISDILNIPITTLRTILEEMQYLDLIRYKRVIVGGSKKPTNKWQLTDKLREISSYMLTKI